MAAVRSPLGNWPELGDVPFTDIVQELSLKDKIACESVCKQWRAQLRDAPAPRLWGKVVTVTNSVASAVTYLPEEPRIVLPGSDDHRLNLAEWLARRSTGMQYLRLHSTVTFNDAPDDARKMCYLLEPLQAVAKPNLILDFMDAPVLMRPEICKLVHLMCVELKLCAKISDAEWASIRSFANLVKLHMFAGLPCDTSTLQLAFPKLTHLSLGSWGTSTASEVRMRLGLICNLTTLTYLYFTSYVLDTTDGLAELPTSLTRLSKLRELHVHSINSISASVSMLTSLQVLSLRPLPSSNVDLSGLTQLTSLRLYGSEHSTCHLPQGDCVGLQRLVSEQADCALTNLSDATAMTYLELKLVERLQWPTTLQRLQTLRLVDSTARSGPFINLYSFEQFAPPEVYMEAIPSEWQYYSSLTCLEMPKLAMQEDMPLWLTALGQLKELDMPNATFYDFPDRLLQLTSIEVLKLHYFNTHLKGKIAGLADLPALRFLDFGWSGHFDRNDYMPFHTDDGLSGLEELEVALRDRPSKLWRVAYPAPQGTLAAGTKLTFTDKSFFNFELAAE